MAGRPVNLTTAEGGINLQRTKGSARANTLRDFLNGYVDHDGIPTSRYGSRAQAITGVGTLSKGLTAYKKALYAFAHEPVAWATQPGQKPVTTIVLRNRRDLSSPIRKVWFVGEYMGLLYVAVEYENGDVIHFWLEQVAEWTPDTIYSLGQLVRPPGDDTGFVYVAGRVGAPYPAWAAGVARTVGDRVEPTTQTGWYYEVTATAGDSPRSGSVEPVWPQVDGAVVYEDVDTGAPDSGVPSPPSDTALPPSLGDRYNNPNTRSGDSRSEQ